MEQADFFFSLAEWQKNTRENEDLKESEWEKKMVCVGCSEFTMQNIYHPCESSLKFHIYADCTSMTD